MSGFPTGATGRLKRNKFVPPPLNKIEDTGLSPLWLQDLVLKIIYYQGVLTGYQVAEAIALPFAGLVDQMLDILKRDKYVEVRSTSGAFGEGGYIYDITSLGTDRAREALIRSQYAGPAPVPDRVRRLTLPGPLGLRRQPDAYQP